MLNETSGVDPRVQDYLERYGCPICPCAKDIKLEVIEKGPSVDAQHQLLPFYCPLVDLVLSLLNFFLKWSREGKKQRGKLIPCGLPSLAEKAGGFFRTNLYGLYGELDLIRAEALKLASLWTSTGLAVQYFFFQFEETAEELRELATTLGLTVLPEFIPVVCQAQLAKMVLDSPRNDVLIVPLLPFPETLQVLKGLALKSDTVICRAARNI